LRGALVDTELIKHASDLRRSRYAVRSCGVSEGDGGWEPSFAPAVL